MYRTVPYLTSSCSITHKASTSLYHPAILKCVSGFSYEIFVQDGTFSHCPIPNLEGQVMQFPWPFIRNLPDMVEHTRSQLVQPPGSSRHTNLPTTFLGENKLISSVFLCSDLASPTSFSPSVMAASMSAGGIGYGRSPLVCILSCLMNFSFYYLFIVYLFSLF